MKTHARQNISLTANNNVSSRLQSLSHWCLSLLLLAGFLAASPQLSARGCDTVSFNQVRYTAGASPFQVVTADLNGDSHPDFVLPNDGDIVVYYGDGGTGFAGPNNFAAGIFPHDVAVGDFNGDGKPDLAVVAGEFGEDGTGVEILLNNGDGTFSAPTLYPAEDNPLQIATGDFNGDGKLDLAVTDNSSGNVDILLGTGTGAFGPPAKFPGTATPAGIVVRDFNGDHKLDLAISNYGSQDVRILQGDGNGNFTVIHSYPLSGNASRLALGDFNHDGHADLAVGVFNISPGYIAVFLGNGDGSFTAGQPVLVDDAQGLVAVDLNGDGNQDLAAATYSNENITVVLGDGTGQFGAPMAFRMPGMTERRHPFPFAVATADFNGDGRPDLVTANSGSGTSTVFFDKPCPH